MNLFSQFAGSVVVLPDGSPWHPPEDRLVFVISGCCPYSLPMDDASNGAFHRALQRRLERGFPEASMEEVKGMAPDGSWEELSWAVEGLTEPQAVAIGRLFYQWAIFRFENGRKAVVSCWS